MGIRQAPTLGFRALEVMWTPINPSLLKALLCRVEGLEFSQSAGLHLPRGLRRKLHRSKKLWILQLLAPRRPYRPKHVDQFHKQNVVCYISKRSRPFQQMKLYMSCSQVHLDYCPTGVPYPCSSTFCYFMVRGLM